MELYDSVLPWVLLSAAPLLDLLVSFLLCLVDRSMRWENQPIEDFAHPQSKARPYFLFWKGLFGAVMTMTSLQLMVSFLPVSTAFAIWLGVFLALFCILSQFATAFTPTKDEYARRGRKKNADSNRGASMVGQFLLLPANLVLLVLLYQDARTLVAILSSIACGCTIVCAVFSIRLLKAYASNPSDTSIGFWQRAYLLFGYLPFVMLAFSLLIA